MNYIVSIKHKVKVRMSQIEGECGLYVLPVNCDICIVSVCKLGPGVVVQRRGSKGGIGTYSSWQWEHFRRCFLVPLHTREVRRSTDGDAQSKFRVTSQSANALVLTCTQPPTRRDVHQNLFITLLFGSIS